MVELVVWLRAQLDADERIARAAIEAEFLTCGRWLARGPYGDDDRHGNIQSELNEQIIEEDLLWPQVVHIAAHDPVQVLREVQSKRLLIKAWASMLDVGPDVEGGYIKPCREALAAQARNFLIVSSLPYADRPGYAEAIASID